MLWGGSSTSAWHFRKTRTSTRRVAEAVAASGVKVESCVRTGVMLFTFRDCSEEPMRVLCTRLRWTAAKPWVCSTRRKKYPTSGCGPTTGSGCPTLVDEEGPADGALLGPFCF